MVVAVVTMVVVVVVVKIVVVNTHPITAPGLEAALFVIALVLVGLAEVVGSAPGGGGMGVEDIG